MAREGSRRGKYKMRRLTVQQPVDVSIRHIPLSQGQVAIVDATDFESLSNFNWFAKWSEDMQSFYAGTHIRIDGKLPTVLMHCFLLGRKLVDHKNHNTLDNRRQNLRPATHSQNLANQRRKGPKGVYKVPNGKWIARIGFNGKKINLGTFLVKEDAQKAYANKAKELFGEFAFT